MQSKSLSAIDGQQELPLVRKVEPVDVPMSVIMNQPNLAAAIALCVQVSGLEEKEIYLDLGVDAGHWTRIMKGDAHFPVNKLNDLCDLCGNEAPLQWWANSRSYGLVLLKSEAERQRDEALLKAQEAEKENALLRNLLIGRAA